MLFEQKYPLQKRIHEAVRILSKYPDRIPVICTHLTKPKETHKFLIPKDMTVGELVVTIRSRMILTKEHAIFLFVKHTIPINTMTLSQLYCLYKNEDGFLYVSYSEENTFG